ncbi:hypothetical protein L1987_33190 [Smallanthus sonchifolius]|uniref:Uncharacterized protein n=1 Tax=Smallanthus sonchifolius TaxID=185202 RepID=A0ACB9HQC5_9ASTR|nr:hypothetical protein L1987_33190 [Smallanthus sonchifolius]
MVNQLLAGVHIASAAEVMAFGARFRLDRRSLFDDIKHSEGISCPHVDECVIGDENRHCSEQGFRLGPRDGGSLRRKRWKHGSGFVNVDAEQILSSLEKEMDLNRL